MKKTLTLLLLFTSILMFSQKGFETNVGISMHYNQMRKSSFGAKNIKGGIGYGVFVDENYYFNEHFGIGTGVELMKLKVDFYAFLGDVRHSYTIQSRNEVRFLETNIPLYIILRTKKNKSFRFGISSGLAFRYILLARTTIIIDSERKTGVADLRAQGNPLYNWGNFGLTTEYFYKKNSKVLLSLNVILRSGYTYFGMENKYYTDSIFGGKVYTFSISLSF